MTQTVHVPVLVIGSGISGLFTALKLAEFGIHSLLVTKSTLCENNSRYAQGGIAAVLPQNVNDSLESHVQDTLIAGAGLCNEEAVRSIISDGYQAIEDLLLMGVPFDRDKNQQLALTREAAHSVSRILHVGGDATGYSMEMTLIQRVRENPNISVMEFCQGIELLETQGRCSGCRIWTSAMQATVDIHAEFTVLATGGLGRLYSYTTNPRIATGDGLALAYQIGTKLSNLEFIQFHPTALYVGEGPQFLISEALRGEGAVLRNNQGEQFAKRYNEQGELAPRDILTRAIFAEMAATGSTNVFLDITHIPAARIEARFPTILSSCLPFGIDIRKDWIPVSPATHYLMGGVVSDPSGRTTIEGLYVVGETACTGLQGANRLASNSLLECVVLARRVATDIASRSPENSTIPQAEAAWIQRCEIPGQPGNCPEPVRTAQHQLKTLLWESAGIVREGHRLEKALETIDHIASDTSSIRWQPDQAGIQTEWQNRLLLSRLICGSALARRESRGAHYRADFPDLDPDSCSSVIQRPEPASASCLSL